MRGSRARTWRRRSSPRSWCGGPAPTCCWTSTTSTPTASTSRATTAGSTCARCPWTGCSRSTSRAARGMGAQDVAILDEFQREPGLRWNVENLRFRATHHVLTTLRNYLPITLHLLTRGDEDWQRDLVYEYLWFHRWDELGRRMLAE